MSLPGRFVDTTAGRVFVASQGPHAGTATENGPPILLLHGFMLSHWVWRDVLALLPKDREVWSVDLPGFGESDRPDPAQFAYDLPAYAALVEELLGHLGADTVDLVGHSMGGGVALTLAARYPKRVGRVVAISPAILPLPLPPEGKILLTPGVGQFLWKTFVTKDQMRRMMLRDHFRDPRPVTEAFVDYYWSRLNRAGGREASYAALRTLGTASALNPDIEAVSAPTLLVFPDEDRVVPLPLGRELLRRIPGARLEILPACGHNAQLERPDELVRIFTPFLERRGVASAA